MGGGRLSALVDIGKETKHGGESEIDSPARTASCALRSYFESSGRSIIELLLFNPTKVCHRQQTLSNDKGWMMHHL